MATIDLGTDISAYPDYDPLGTLVSGTVALCQRIARRLTNPRGAWSWAPNECTDIRSYLNEVLTREKQLSMQSDITREVLREEGVNTVNVDLTISPLSLLGQTITLHISGTTSNGPFKFVLSVTAVNLTILQAG